MAGLVPAIHVFAHCKKDVDARHKAGHDGECSDMAKPRYYLTTAIAYPNGVPH